MRSASNLVESSTIKIDAIRREKLLSKFERPRLPPDEVLDLSPREVYYAIVHAALRQHVENYRIIWQVKKVTCNIVMLKHFFLIKKDIKKFQKKYILRNVLDSAEQVSEALTELKMSVANNVVSYGSENFTVSVMTLSSDNKSLVVSKAGSSVVFENPEAEDEAKVRK